MTISRVNGALVEFVTTLPNVAGAERVLVVYRDGVPTDEDGTLVIDKDEQGKTFATWNGERVKEACTAYYPSPTPYFDWVRQLLGWPMPVQHRTEVWLTTSKSGQSAAVCSG